MYLRAQYKQSQRPMMDCVKCCKWYHYGCLCMNYKEWMLYNLGLEGSYHFTTFSLVCKLQTISSETYNHFVKHGNQTEEQNLQHRKHGEMCVEYENETKNSVEATFAEISDGEWILKKQWFLRFKSDHKSTNNGDIKLVSSQYIVLVNKESNRYHGSRIQVCVWKCEEWQL